MNEPTELTDAELTALGKQAARQALTRSALPHCSDIAQDAMIDFDRKRRRGDHIENPAGLIRVIARRRAWRFRDRWELERDRPVADEDIAAPAPDDDPYPEVAIDWLMSHLDDRDREIALLTWGEGLKAPAVAQRVGLAPGTVRNRLVRIRRHLRQVLADDDGGRGATES